MEKFLYPSSNQEHPQTVTDATVNVSAAGPLTNKVRGPAADSYEKYKKGDKKRLVSVVFTNLYKKGIRDFLIY